MRIGKIMGKRFATATAAVLSLSLVALLAGCTGQASSSNSSQQAEETDLVPLTFVLDWTPNTNHTGIYVAIDKGYYQDAGLDVTVVQPSEDGADALVGSGNAPLGMSYQEYMAGYLGSDNPLPVTAIAAVIQHNTSGIMSRAGEGIDHPGGLVGKQYGTLDVESEKAIVKSMVEADGGDWAAVEVVPGYSTDEVSGLKTDMFDAVWVFEGWAGQNAKIQDYPVDYFSVRSIDETFDYYTPVIIANNTWLAENPELAEAFLAATAKGYAYASENSDDAAEILVKYAPEVDIELARASQEFLKDQYTADAPYWGYIDQERWDRFYTWMADQGLVTIAIEPGVGFTNEYLPKEQ